MNAQLVPGVSRPTTLYRHFAADGSLLYVGISLSWPSRTKAHLKGSKWFNEVSRVTIERFPTRQEALDAEKLAIKAEKPRYNIIHNRAGTQTHSHAPRKPRASFSLNAPVDYIRGPLALVGPALIYRDDKWSVMIAWGEPGTGGELTEMVLGACAPEAPDWANACASVLILCTAGELSRKEACETRSEIIQGLRSRMDVEAYDTDIALAVAYASHFPSAKSREVLDQVAAERGGSQ